MLRYSLRIECHRNSCKYLDSYKFCGNPSLKFACFRDYKQDIPPPDPDSIPDSSSPDSSSPDESSPEAGSIPDDSSPKEVSIPVQSGKLKLRMVVNLHYITAMIEKLLKGALSRHLELFLTSKK